MALLPALLLGVLVEGPKELATVVGQYLADVPETGPAPVV